jgi:Flp pilus assembly protein TadD
MGPRPHVGRLAIALGVALASAAPLAADKHSEAKDHVPYGMELAQVDLWHDAVEQWKQAVTIDPDYAAAWNDLAIGYEQIGKFPEAREAYDKALAIDPDNRFIRSNYDQFRIIYDRMRVRSGGG